MEEVSLQTGNAKANNRSVTTSLDQSTQKKKKKDTNLSEGVWGTFICLLSLTNFIYPLPKNVINPSGDDCILGEIFTSHDFKSSKFVNSPNPKQHQFRQQIKQNPGEAFMSRRCCWIFSS